MPAVTEYQGDGDRLCVLTGPKVARRSPQQLLEVVVHVQLLEDSLDQRARQRKGLGRGDCCEDYRRSGVAAPSARGTSRGTWLPPPGGRLAP